MIRRFALLRGVLVGLGTVGSLFVKKTSEGKYEVAIAPIVLAAAIGSGITCAVQKDEPFRQCVKTTMAMFQEVVHAN